MYLLPDHSVLPEQTFGSSTQAIRKHDETAEVYRLDVVCAAEITLHTSALSTTG